MLKDTHLALGARYTQYFGVDAVAEYASGADAEYAAAHSAAILVDRSFIGRIELAGADRVDFLQRMTTNEMRNHPVGSGIQTVLTTPEGRIVDLLTVLVRPETLLVLASPSRRLKVLDWFRRNIFFRDKVKPADISDATGLLSVMGPRARSVINALTGGALPHLDAWHSALVRVGDVDVLIIADPAVTDGFDLVIPADRAPQIWNALLSAGQPYGLQPAGTRALEMLRIERAVPAAGAELGDDVNPLEAGLREAVSFSKGCYTGQEVIARTENYQKLKQVLVSLLVESSAELTLPAPLVDSDQVGRVTSVAHLPGQRVAAGLGYVRAKRAIEGAVFRIGADGSQGTATIRVPPGVPSGAAE